MAGVPAAVRAEERAEGLGSRLPGLLAVRGAHGRAPCVDGVRLGQAEGVDGARGHELHETGKEGLAGMFRVEFLRPPPGQLRAAGASGLGAGQAHVEGHPRRWWPSPWAETPDTTG